MGKGMRGEQGKKSKSHSYDGPGGKVSNNKPRILKLKKRK